MKDKINVAELLKYCPKGMELDCTMYDNCTFERIEDVGYIDILVKTPSGIIRLTKEGCYIRHDDYAKCVIFPKGKTTWEGFHRPYINGDIVYTVRDSIAILGDRIGEHSVGFRSYCGLFNYEFDTDVVGSPERFATEEEKEKLFQAIKDNGYKWNSETNTLEKLVEPKFNVGDKIRHKTHIRQGNVVTEIKDTHYILDDELVLPFISQDEYELVPNKFDINTLVPFESRVLARDNEREKWHPGIWGFYDSANQSYPYKLIGDLTRYCIPYEGNEHLLGTTNDCDEYFKTWK